MIEIASEGTGSAEPVLFSAQICCIQIDKVAQRSIISYTNHTFTTTRESESE